MANSGYLQAVVVYKVRAADNAPLDTDGNPITIDGVPTGRKQAIAILAGAVNPNPALYDVQFTYSPDGAIDGVPTVEQSDNCPTGFIFASFPRVILQTSDPEYTTVITSSGAWTLTQGLPYVTVTPAAGGRGTTAVKLTRTATLGQGVIIFTNTITGQTAQIKVINVDVKEWILEDGTWNNLGFWFNNSLWNY